MKSNYHLLFFLLIVFILWSCQKSTPPPQPYESTPNEAQLNWQKIETIQNGYQFNVNRDYLLPLPTQEVTLNLNLTQNIGW